MNSLHVLFPYFLVLQFFWAERLAPLPELSHTRRSEVKGERSLPLEVEQTLFRFVQEALSNIARHSQARNAEIFLSYEENWITLSVSDNGIGFDKNLWQPGLGLKSMRERAELLNGILTIDSASGMGTRVSMKCPNLE